MRLLERDQGLGDPQEVFHVLGRPAEGGTEGLGTRRATVALLQPGGCRVQGVLALHHMAREPNRAVLLVNSPADRLPNPPVGIGDKAPPAPRLKLVHGPHQPQIAFLNQVEERHPAVPIAQGNMNDQPEIGLHHQRFGLVQRVLGPRPGMIGRVQGGVLGIALPGGG